MTQWRHFSNIDHIIETETPIFSDVKIYLKSPELFSTYYDLRLPGYFEECVIYNTVLDRVAIPNAIAIDFGLYYM